MVMAPFWGKSVNFDDGGAILAADGIYRQALEIAQFRADAEHGLIGKLRVYRNAAGDYRIFAGAVGTRNQFYLQFRGCMGTLCHVVHPP